MNLRFLLTLMLAPTILRADDNKQKIETEPASITIFLTGAEVLHKKQVTLAPGRNELVFVGLSSKLIPKSIQFTASGSVSLLAISNRIDYIFGQKKNDVRINQINDSLEQISDALEILSGQIEAFESEKNLLRANQNMSGKEKSLSAAELKLSADFYRSRITEINTEMVKLRRKQDQQSEIQNRLSMQLNEANRRTNPPMGEITILVNVTGSAKITSDITLHYVVSDAGWAPSYDLVAEDVGKPIELKYRAKVFNNTDVDWKDIKLKLSTADPMRSASAPQLEKWTLNFENPNNYASQYQQQQQSVYGGNAPASLSQQNLYNNNDVSYDSMSKEEVQQDQKKAIVPVQYEQIQISELSAEFDIKSTYDIPSDGRPYIVDVTSYNLSATYEYRAVPKIEREAFLLARITGWEQSDLVEGPANIYFGGTYVGQSYIYTRSVDDTLDLSLGRDQKLVVTRTKLKEFNSEKSSTTTRKETYSYEMVIKNTRNAPVHVMLIDQIPISQDAEIIVTQMEVSGGNVDPATGFVEWGFDIPPGQTVKVVITYSIKYPKNKVVNTRKYKSRSRAKF
ncbi:MAG: DUF4139 domain-containing protein [Bacteroidia bacterium]